MVVPGQILTGKLMNLANRLSIEMAPIGNQTLVSNIHKDKVDNNTIQTSRLYLS